MSYYTKKALEKFAGRKFELGVGIVGSLGAGGATALGAHYVKKGRAANSKKKRDEHYIEAAKLMPMAAASGLLGYTGFSNYNAYKVIDNATNVLAQNPDVIKAVKKAREKLNTNDKIRGKVDEILESVEKHMP